jgi:hypothetical protein
MKIVSIETKNILDTLTDTDYYKRPIFIAIF